MKIDTKRSPLVIIGIDAGDPNFIRDWAQSGYLPTISSIMKRGCWGKTSGPELISEHGVWVSLFSGISRSRHGYYYFRQLKPETYELKTVTGLDIDAPPFWKYLAEDKKVLALDVPDSRILEELPGIQLTNWATHNNWNPDFYKPVSNFPELLQEVSRKFGRKHVMPENHHSTFDEDKEMYRKLLNHVEKKGAACRYLIEKDNFDLIVTVFAESHAANHQFWKYLPQTEKNGTGTDLRHAVRDIYSAIDGQIGLILKQLPETSNVIIVSSVGMKDHFPNDGLAGELLRTLGYQASQNAGEGFSLSPIDLARRLIPESLRMALSKNLSRERREKLLSDGFKSGTDWKRTKAFSLPSSYTSFIRVNLKGREPEGIVEPGAEYGELLNQIEGDLKELIDPETGEPAVMRVGRTASLFDCDPHDFLPDIFVEWKPGSFMKRVLHPKAELTQEKPEFFRRSDHSSNGFFAAAGPSIETKGELSEIELLSLAPTFLSLLGKPIPDKIVGKPIKLSANM